MGQMKRMRPQVSLRKSTIENVKEEDDEPPPAHSLPRPRAASDVAKPVFRRERNGDAVRARKRRAFDPFESIPTLIHSTRFGTFVRSESAVPAAFFGFAGSTGRNISVSTARRDGRTGVYNVPETDDHARIPLSITHACSREAF